MLIFTGINILFYSFIIKTTTSRKFQFDVSYSDSGSDYMNCMPGYPCHNATTALPCMPGYPCNRKYELSLFINGHDLVKGIIVNFTNI